MKIVRRFFAGGKLRDAERELASRPSPSSYALLAEEHAKLGEAEGVLRVCREGLAAFPGSPELAVLHDRARRMLREARMAELKGALKEAPRSALWREMCELLLESGELGRAEECAEQWIKQSREPEGLLYFARACVERFLADRGRQAGRRAFQAIDDVQRALPADARPLHLRLHLCGRIGALAEARNAVAGLLKLSPGDPLLEARYRALEGQAQGGLDVEAALREVEKSGELIETDQQQIKVRSDVRDLRPLLAQLAVQPGVHAALYVRGGTALVQGPKGATAERMARSVRQVVVCARSSARRLGLGSVREIVLEGDFGVLAVATGELDAGALWCDRMPSARQSSALSNLAGREAEFQQGQEGA